MHCTTSCGTPPRRDFKGALLIERAGQPVGADAADIARRAHFQVLAAAGELATWLVIYLATVFSAYAIDFIQVASKE